MHTKALPLRLHTLAALICFSGCRVLLSADIAPQPDLQIYRVQMQGAVQIALPVPTGVTQALFQAGDAQWRPVQGEVRDNVLRFSLDPKDIPTGRTTLLIGKTDSIDLTDTEPPAVVRFVVDGADHGAVPNVALGGVERVPATVVIEIADKLNALKPTSLAVGVNGQPVAVSGEGVTFEQRDPKRAIITLDLAKLLPKPPLKNAVAVSIDDWAIDDQGLDCSLAFTYVAPYTLPDGRVVAVDTLEDKPGWAKWWVMFDGVHMENTHATTAGFTWLSEPNELPHWVQVRFPAPATVKGVRIWWAYYQSFRSSSAYTVQAWDGKAWTDVLAVKNQPTAQSSEHMFPQPVTTDMLRIWQPAKSGNAVDPRYMWVSELEVLQ
ncbi:MAG: hypothetical protein A3K19_23665 [Lentisphaerae bacterium RIFOXYB12_FULL_65_16]|nr:MAG: hypothetical protein A3K18_18660 [Lentisphaerae bacterium RIFOXYA12_64_32]OGV94108.1 MAG: hypothetical protein A3K19_23665 [Lentisphaerae bacterium RIFOXYB12_FULL_65_16]